MDKKLEILDLYN
ncbi:hypothetical protein VTH82DRAFT_8540 [Thermothelomyces myriococcoides]